MSILTELNLSRRKRLPAILSSEVAECGLACLAMIGRYHGHDIDLNGLRQRFALSMSGASLRSLMAIGDQLGFGARALRVELEMLGKVQIPAVLHWNLDHFVVLKSVGRKRIVIHDPALGVCALTIDQVSKHFTGVVLELTPAATFRKIEARETVHLNSLWSKSIGFWGAASQVLGLSAALQIATFAAPFQIQLVVDEAIGRADGALLTVLAIGFGTLIVIQALLDALREWALQVFGNMLTFQMVGNLVRHLLRLPSDFFEKRHVGDILSRISSTSAIQDMLTKGVVSALIDGVMALIAAAIMFLYSSALAGIVMTAVLLNLVSALCFYPIMRRRMEEQLVTSANERSHMMESVRAATIIKLMGREAERESAWRNLYANVINATISLGKFQIGVTFFQTAITGVSTILVIYMGAHTIIAGGGFSIGMLLAFLSFRQTFSDRASSLINQAVQFRLLGLHLERLSDIITAVPEARSIASPQLDIKGAITIRGVSFRYGAADPFVLQDIWLDIAPGEFIAITGQSGGGKTTLTKLMLGLRDPTDGEILLDGQTATSELWRTWRTQVGVVAQDDRLLSGSVAENISFFDPDLDMARVQSAAQAAQVHDDIVKMPMQYLSLIGDMGSSLSGGQRQRILLARALYRQPKVLILDEGTANLDERTETLIGDLITKLPITRIIIAHRPALIQRASRVVVLNGGNLFQLGSSNEQSRNFVDNVGR